MMTVKICVGSSCHLKGSYDIIEQMKRLVKENGLEDKIELKASFCFGHCVDGVTLERDDTLLHNVNKDNVEQVFREKILPLLEK